MRKMAETNNEQTRKAAEPRVRGQRKRWYKLDLSANVYPTLQRRNYSSVYRISVTLTTQIDAGLLQKALDMTLPRFPIFALAIHKGFFWRYLDVNKKAGPFVKRDVANPCMPMRFRADNGYLIRVYVYENRISFEAFHSVADGSGALCFLKTLIAQYLRLSQKISISNTDGVLDINEAPAPEETEDAYLRYGKARLALKRKGSKAYHVRGTMEPFYTLNIITGILPVAEALARARAYQVSLGEYLTGVLIYVLLQKQKEEGRREREVKVALPVNLRRFFPSATLRNFIVMVQPYVDPRLGEYSFEEVLREVHHYMQYYINEKYLRASIYTNLHIQQHPLIRVVPLFLKDIVVRSSYKRTSDLQSTVGFTNLGIVRVPEEMRPFVRHFEVLMGQPFSNRTNLAAVTYGEELSLSFSSAIVESDVEMRFFRHLVQDGISVTIQSNRSRRPV